MRTQTQQGQQQSETQLSNQVQQTASEIRRQALENARAQLEAQRAQLEAQRAQLEVQQNQGSGVAAIPPIPAAPGAPRVTITRDGKTVTIAGADGAPGPFAQTGTPGFIFRPAVPPGAVTISIAFFVMLAFIVVGLPLARAWARRMDRNSAGARPLPFPSDVTDRLERIEHAVESVAIEVERISEGQRFTTKLLTDRGDGAATALPVARPDEFAGGGR